MSDGKYTPQQLLEHAHEIGLSALSITDHDTVAAYTEETKALAETLGLHLIPGIEISTFYDGESIHVLGYNIDTGNSELKRFLERLGDRREKRNKEMLKKLQAHAIFVDESELPNLRKCGRPHMAYVMIEKGYVRTVTEAFKKYLGDGKPAYVRGDEIPTELAIEVIHNSGGKAVLAHPHLIKRKRILKRVLQLPFDGLECYYGSMTKDREEGFVAIAEEKKLIKTGGSDFHGIEGSHATLGRSWTNEEDFYALTN